MYSARYSCQVSMKLEFSGRIFEKYSNTKFRENPCGGNRIVGVGRTDRHESNCRLSKFCEST